MKQADDSLILVVDDDSFMRTYLRDLLGKAGFGTVVAGDGATAIDIFVSEQPDLVLLDLNMAGMDGIQTCRGMRVCPNGTYTPILMVTSSDDDTSIRRAYATGATDFITKPVKPGILIHRIRHILRAANSTKMLAKDKARLEMMRRIARLADWEWDPLTDEFRISDKSLKLLGFAPEGHIDSSKSFVSIFPYHYRGKVAATLRDAVTGESCCFFEIPIAGSEPSPSVFRLHGRAISETSEAGRIVIGTIQDVTQIWHTENRNLMLRQAIECLPIGITLVDRNGKIIYVNPAEAEMHGYSVENLIGTEARNFADSRLRKPFLPKQLDGFELWSRESVNLRKNGQEFPVQLTSVVVRNADGEILGMVTACEDITQRKNAENKIHRLAYFDSLTGLPNRCMFHDRLCHVLSLACRESQKVGLLFLDLDNFKDVNDTLGHNCGDKLLQAVAKRLSVNMRESDILARVGGDEFVIVLSLNCDQKSASTAAERIISLFAEPFTIEGRVIYSNASIGIAMYPDDGHDAETLLRCADNAMYHAKNEGRARYRFYSLEMHQNMLRRVAIENSLRKGVEREEFFLLFQPQWDLNTARMTGVEVLLRWDSIEFGVIPPAEFILRMEDSGLIHEIGEWIIRTACSQAKVWGLSGCQPFRVAINISANQLKHRDFLSMIKRIVGEIDVNPSILEFEFTEGVLMDNGDGNIQILRGLKEMGILMSMDDFGTGYSSLSYLKNFPIDKIKIDRSFVKDLTNNVEGMKIVKAIISLAHSLGLRIVAEGVENGEQMVLLRSLGCHEAQGFYLAEPLEPERVQEMLGYRHSKILEDSTTGNDAFAQ
jgi:diguanylate cyclase (GGDEF)-like protein/PAS domain S-box-containing protein